MSQSEARVCLFDTRGKGALQPAGLVCDVVDTYYGV